MAVLDPNEIFFTAFEPKVANRFILYVDGIPSYIIKSVSGLGFSQDEIILNHINTYRKVKGKLRWNDLTMELFDPITPSGAQAVMEWARLGHESVTGRDGYSEWIIKGAFIKDSSFGDMNWDDDSTVMNISLTVGMDYCVLNF